MSIGRRSFGNRWSGFILCVLGIVGILPTNAQSAMVTFNFSGRVTSVGDAGNISGIIVGDLITGSGAYDTAAPDLSPDPTKYLASFSSGSAFLTVNVHASAGVLSFSVGPGTNGEPIYLWNYDQSGYSPGDYFEFGGSNTNGVDMPAFTSGLFNQIDVNFMDQLAPFDMVDGIAPPVGGLPDLTKVTSTASFVRGFSNSGGNEYNVEFTIESTIVPEPATFVTWGFGALGMMFTRRKRQQKKQAV